MADSKQAESKEAETNDVIKGIQDKVINTIVLLYAMVDEAMPLIQRFKLKLSEERSKQMVPFPVYTNGGESIFVVVNGKDPKHKCDKVGTQWAAVAAYLCIHHFSPDVVINAGTCGGVVPKHCFDDIDSVNESDPGIADVYIGKVAIYSDRRIGIPMFKPWDIGQYQLFGWEYLSKKVKGLKVGQCIATSNAFDFTSEDKVIYQENGVVCKEMECAAIAEMCTSFGVKIIALKGVTDLVAKHDEKNFQQNLAKTASAITDAVEAVVQEIKGKKLSDIGSL